MNIHLRPDQETQLAKLAQRMGRPAEQVAQEAIDALFDHDAWFSAEVAKGFAQLDRGEFVTREEVRARIDRLLKS